MLSVLALLSGTPRALQAQWKIPSRVHDWKVLNTEHFRIHYPKGYEEMALQGSVYAEEAAARLENIFHHRLQAVVPVFIYASNQDFAANNIYPFDMGESVGGFTDFDRSRVVVPFDGDYALFRHVLVHEIVHAYQFDILRGDNYGLYPLWLMEGMAEYLSTGWDDSAERFVRDAILHDRMPTLLQLHSGAIGDGYTYYKAGQAIMLFIASRWGEERIGHFLKEIHSLRNYRTAFLSSFRMEPEEFDIEFGQFLRARYAPAMEGIIKGRDDRLRSITNRYRDRIGFNLRPVLSPDAKRVAYITVDRIFPVIVIRPVPGPGVTAERASEKRIVIRALRSGDYEEFQPMTTRLTFTPDGRRILVAGRRDGRQSLLLIDVKSGSVVSSFSPPFDAMQYPALSPDGKRVYFVGVARGKADLFSMDLDGDKGGKLVRYTNNLSHESDPAVTQDGHFLYYASREPGHADEWSRDIYRLDLRNPDRPPLRLTGLSGESRNPMPAKDGSLLFISDFTGVDNIYRIENADSLTSPVEAKDLTAVTASQGGVEAAAYRTDPRKQREMVVFTDLEEGAREVKLLPGGVERGGSVAKDPERITAVPVLPEKNRTFDPAKYSFPTHDYPIPPARLASLTPFPYSPSLAFDANTILFVTGGSDSEGNTSFGFFGYTSLSDDSGNHKVDILVSHLDRPVTNDINVRYSYLKYRTKLFMGAYKQTGIYAIYNFSDFSLNNLIYNPYFRLLSQNASGGYLGADYPLHRFGSVGMVYDVGREERVFRSRLDGERPQKDIYDNYQAVTYNYNFNNVVYSYFGPMDGHAVYLGYTTPLRPTGSERQLYTSVGEYRYYHLFGNFSTFAFRAFAGMASGRDADKYPFRIGGYSTIRGYDFQQFEGTKAFLLNAEYRFNLINFIRFGFPFQWSTGTIRGVFFTDAGSAFDDMNQYMAVDMKRKLAVDLHLSYGAGIHFVNFLWFLIPGAIMKIEWATPYDLKQSLPVKKWRGEFSVGFNF